MDPLDLRCFEAVAATASFSAAARRVHLSPTALSDRVKRLEAHLGARLFERTSRRVALTPEGARALPLARDVLARLDQLPHALHAPSAPTPYTLTIGTRWELGLSWLVPSLTPLAHACPERTIHLATGDGPALLAQLARGELDAVVGSMRLGAARLRSVVLHPEPYVLVTRPDVRLRRVEDAARLTLLDVSPDRPLFRYLLDATPPSTPWGFAGELYLGGIAAIRARLLERGADTVAVLPRYFVADALRARRLVRRLPRFTPASDAFRLIWRADHPRGDALLALAEALRARPLT